MVVKPECEHGADGHGQVGGDSEVADSDVSTGRGHDVDGHGGVGNGYGTESQSVRCPQDGEHEQGACYHVAGEEGDKDEVAEKEEGLPGEVVCEES